MTIPIGGSTGCDHEHSAAVDEAAAWLSQTPPQAIGKPVIPALRQRFGLTPLEACEAVREANLRRARAI
ncbi:hypothetical protein [Mesorhizobium sp. CAU 1741]|uniref:hypothetical protein n=1 Tax=Mesorhizobium sp. CAU 1741 TaxID=3140366 RepID=UPI00325ADD31